MSQPHVIRGPLTREIDNPSSPVRQFLDDRFSGGLRDVQRRFRQATPPLAVPSVPQAEANPGTVGGATDWLLRFMACPDPSVDLAVAGAARLSPWMMLAVAEVAGMLGVTSLPGTLNPGVSPVSGTIRAFTGPTAGSRVDQELLARGCWALALATEAFRSPQAAAMGPLARFPQQPLLADDLLALAPPAGTDQLASFRHVFEGILIPQLAARPGAWALGPTFSGSAMIGGADGDLITAALLLDLKTSAKLTLAVKDLFQVIAYALLDFDDEYKLTELGIFSARYAYLATWDLATLLGELAGHQVSLQLTRQEFCHLLLMHRSPAR
ncbi:MAG TPA: hypothetical protein VHZ03_35530 [Trebonia sp.]|jgi:hypothetical protein|nr:hypothetical protein [Trebonia sp.]